MSINEAVASAVKSIWASKTRSFLTMLGIIIGIFAVTALVSVGQSSNAAVTEQIESMGSNLITVRLSDRRIDLSVDDVAALTDLNGVRYASPYVSASYTIKNGSQSMDSVQVYAVTSDFAKIREYTVQKGRFISENDNSKRLRVAVVGTDVATELYGTLNVTNETINVNGTNFTIIGVLESMGTSEGGSQDELVIIPYATGTRFMQNTTISTVYVGASSSAMVETAVASLKSYFSGIAYSQSGYSVLSQTSILESLSSVANTQSAMLGGIAGISLLVGGIGIMNIMLVSVTERTREIGIRKAVGATRFDILMQFLIESVFVSGLGGLLGVILAFAGSDFIGQLLSTAITVETWVAVAAMIFSMAVGIVFGLYPAIKASKLNPIEALHYE